MTAKRSKTQAHVHVHTQTQTGIEKYFKRNSRSVSTTEHAIHPYKG